MQHNADQEEGRCRLCDKPSTYLTPYYTSPGARPIYVCPQCRQKLRQPVRRVSG